jgi:hypothetical protein
VRSCFRFCVCIAAAFAVSVVIGGSDCPSSVTIEIDLDTGESATRARCVRHGGTVTIVVDRINPFLYDVAINDQVFRSGFPPSPEFETLGPPSLPEGPFRGTAFDDAVRGYTSGVRELYLVAGEVERRLRALVYGAPTPTRDELRNEALRVVRGLLGIEEGDISSASEEVLRSGHEAYEKLEVLYRAARTSSPKRPDGKPTAEIDWITKAHGEVIDDRPAVLARFRAAADLLSQLSRARFRIASAPIVAGGDSLSAVISVTLREGLAPESHPVAFEMEAHEVARIRTGGGFTIGLSAGLIFSSPVDAEYTTEDIGGTGVIARGGDEDIGSAGLGVLLHVYQRKPGDVNHGPAVGLGVNDGGGVQYILGYGAMIGGKNRVIFSAGGTLSDVERLAGGLAEGDPVPASGVIPTEKKLTLGFYVGVSYRFWGAGGRK